MSFFISDAMAEASSAVSAQPDSMFSIVMIGVIFVLFYFMLIRPQNKRSKEHKEMVTRLKKGDEVITTGGVLAKVVNIDEQYIKLTIAPGVDMMVQRSAVSSILPKGTLKSL